MTPASINAAIAPQQQLVDGPPPVRERGALVTGEHGRPQMAEITSIRGAGWFPRVNGLQVTFEGEVDLRPSTAVVLAKARIHNYSIRSMVRMLCLNLAQLMPIDLG